MAKRLVEDVESKTNTKHPKLLFCFGDPDF